MKLSAARDKSISALRERRTVHILDPNPDPIVDAAREILFTSNVLLTLPPASQPYHALHCSETLKEKLHTISREPQRYWYDHPIHIGVKPQNNELLYGLRGLEEALKFERERGSVAKNAKITCLLSVSVTHQGLHETARPYIEEALSRAGFLKNLEKGLELITIGTQQISKAFEFIRGENSALKKQYENERHGWNLYYDTLDAVEQALKNKDPVALGLQQKAKAIVRECAVGKKQRA